MKQTQTKLFDFSDVGLDFCAGSKSLFPDRFKKMLALGYNVQTVTNVAVIGDQVTFTYGGAHGYVADRVLKVDSGALAAINGGEFWIDSVTTNTVTMVIDNAPLSVANGFTTRIASLGWSLEYEVANVHVYKFKQLDESDVYLRLCFAVPGASRCFIAPCVGSDFDISTGFIVDNYALTANKSVTNPTAQASMFRWEFSGISTTNYDNYSASQGKSVFGSAFMVGSKYHLFFANNHFNSSGRGVVNGLAPHFTHNYPQLNLPLMWGYNIETINTYNTTQYTSPMKAYIGNIESAFVASTNSAANIVASPQAVNAYTTLDSFNTTTVEPLPIYERNTRQHLGYVCGAIYIAKYSATNGPSLGLQNSPFFTADIELESNILVHHTVSGDASLGYATFYAIPVEEIKIV